MSLYVRISACVLAAIALSNQSILRDAGHAQKLVKRMQGATTPSGQENISYQANLPESNGVEASATRIYDIFPLDSEDTTTNVRILGQIQKLENVDPKSIVQYGRFAPVSGVLFWRVPLDQSAKQQIESVPGVYWVKIACLESGGDECSPLVKVKDDLYSRAINTSTYFTGPEIGSSLPKRVNRRNPASRPNARPEMTFLSAYPAQKSRPYSPVDYCRKCVYDNSAGTDVTVYVVGEDDAQINSEEFSSVQPNQIRWIGPSYGQVNPLARVFSRPKYRRPPPPGDDDHGTAVLSKILGSSVGAAANVHVVMVRFPNDLPDQVQAHVTMLKRIREDWYESKKRSKTQVGIMTYSVRAGNSTNFTLRGQNQKWIPLFNEWRDQLNKATQEGLLPISVAGNDLEMHNSIVDSYPPMFAGLNDWTSDQPLDTPAVPMLIVVGAVDSHGRLAKFSKSADYVRQFAPGQDVKVAGGIGPQPESYIDSGTSYSAPTAAGVAAYLAGLDSVRAYWNKQHLTPEQRVQDLYNNLTTPATSEQGRIMATNRWPRNYNLNDGDFPHAIWNGVSSKEYRPHCPRVPTKRNDDPGSRANFT